jgi:hypothetical protein
MPDPRHDDLIQELRDLGPWLATAEPPEVRAAVRQRLTVRPRPYLPRRWLAVATAVLVAILVAIIPPARTAVADAATAVLRFAGIEINQGGDAGSLPATPSPLPSARTTTLAEARRLAGFRIAVPTTLGEPDSVQVADPDPAGAPRVVTLIYRGGTVHLDQFDGEIDPYFAKKVQVAGVRWTEINGQPAVWIPAPHAVTYVDRTGVERTETARLAGSTLIWLSAEASYRLEGELTLDEAVKIALAAG